MVSPLECVVACAVLTTRRLLSWFHFDYIAAQLGKAARDRQIDADSAGFVPLVNDLATGSGKLSNWYLSTHHHLFVDGLVADKAGAAVILIYQ